MLTIFFYLPGAWGDKQRIVWMQGSIIPIFEMIALYSHLQNQKGTTKGRGMLALGMCTQIHSSHGYAPYFCWLATSPTPEVLRGDVLKLTRSMKTMQN